MTFNNNPQVKNSSRATWRGAQKLGAKLSRIYVCVGFLTSGKFILAKPGGDPSKHKGLRRAILSYVLADGAWSYPHATDPSSKGAFYAI